MTWQNYVFLAGNVFFTAVTFPLAFDKRTVIPLYKSVPTGVCLLGFAAANWTLAMPIPAFGQLACALCWIFVAWKRSP